MTYFNFTSTRHLRLPLSFLLAAGLFAASSQPVLVHVDNGVVSFDASTNVSAVTVHGKSSALRARLTVRQNDGQLEIIEVNATLPVEALSTGMSLRDGHMRKYIFTDGAGKAPELQFRAGQLSCPFEAGKEASCKVAGALSIRGIEKPVTIDLKIKADTARGYHASGGGIVRLSDYGIERPSQFGVKVEDAVKIHVDFQGREAVESSARIGDGR